MGVSLNRRLLAGGFWVISGKVVTAGCDALSTVLLVRLLSEGEFGAYGLAFSLSLGGALLAQIGTQQAIVRLVAQAIGEGRGGMARAAVRSVFRLCAVGTAGVAAVLLFGGGHWLAHDLWNSPTLSSVIVTVTAWVVVSSFQVLTSEVFRGFQDLLRATIYGGVVNRVLILLTLSVLWIEGIQIRLQGVVAISAGATAVSLALGVLALRRRLRELPAVEPLPSRDVMSIATPLWINGVATFVLIQFDLWILGAFLPENELAIYFAATRLVVLVTLGLMLVTLVVPPFIAELYFTGERRRLERLLRTTATVAGLPAIVVLIVFIFAGGSVLGFLYTDPYRAAAPILAVLSIGRLVNVLAGSAGVTMSMTGHQRYLMAITVSTGVVSIAASLLVVRPYGAIGVAIVAGGSAAVRGVAMWLVTKRVTGMWTHVAVPRLSEVRALLGRS